MLNRMSNGDHNVRRSKGMLLKKKLMQGKNLHGEFNYKPRSTQSDICEIKNSQVRMDKELNPAEPENNWDFDPTMQKQKRVIRLNDVKSEIDYRVGDQTRGNSTMCLDLQGTSAPKIGNACKSCKCDKCRVERVFKSIDNISVILDEHVYSQHKLDGKRQSNNYHNILIG